MRRILEVFLLELRALVRTKTVATLLVAGVSWMLLIPAFLRGDGTAEGAHELYVRFSLGGVFAFALVALLASATGSLAREREAKRLQLTLVRPVRYCAVVLGKFAAHVVVGAAILAVAGGILAFKTDRAEPCSHVLAPLLPSVREEAKAAYEAYMKDPRTPEAVRKAKKSAVLRLLENRAVDRYQVIPTNAVTTWRFPACPKAEVKVRMRFAAQYNLRQDVRGDLRFGGRGASVSNITQAVLSVPLTRTEASGAVSDELSFFNRGRNALMLRPRKDVNVLVSADAFGWNLLRTLCALTAVMALVLAFGLFLSAGLGRPVALFVAVVTLVVGEMSPSVVDSYADELGAGAADRLGLVLTRVVTEVTRPFSAAAPLESLAYGECVEPDEVLRLILTDLVVLPLLLAFLSACVLPRKQDSAT